MVDSQSGNVFRGAVWLGASTGINSALQFLQVVILARILAPEQVGVVAILAIAVSLIDLMTDLGLSNALIQKKSLTQADISSVYWFNVILGAVLAGSLVLLAPAIADAYSSPELETTLRWLALVFLISPHGLVFRGLLEREHRFREVGIAESSSGVLGIVVTLVSALAGAGAMSYVFGRITNATVRSGLLQVFGRRLQNRVTFSLRVRGTGALLRFGGIQTLDAIVSFVHNSIGTLIVGRVVSVPQLGGFNLAFNLSVTLPGTVNSVFTRAAFPSLSKIQTEHNRLSDGYLKLLRVTGFVNFPLLVGLALVAGELVPVLLGDRWTWIVPVVQILALGGCVRALTSPLGALFMAIGKPQVSLYVNITRTVIVMVSAILAGSHFGVIGVAYAISGTAILTLVLNFVLLKSSFAIPVGRLLAAAFRPMLLVLPMAVVVFAARLALLHGEVPTLLALLIEVALGAIVFLATVYLSKDSLGRELLGKFRRS